MRPIFSGILHGATKDDGIGRRSTRAQIRTGNAAAPEYSVRGHSLRPDADHFAGFYVVYVIGVDQVEAQVSEATHGRRFRRPAAAGQPRATEAIGSRATMTRSCARNTKEKRLQLQQRIAQRPASVRSRERATRCRITSVSLDAWKMDPSRSSSGVILGVVMLPLCATRYSLCCSHRKWLRVQEHGVAGVE